MSNPVDHKAHVINHYSPEDLVGRLQSALRIYGADDAKLTVAQLTGLDHFHTRGVAATEDLAWRAKITAEDVVIDIGAGLGGPARFLAATIGCRVTGLDLSSAFVEAAIYLTERTGQDDKVRFAQGDATAMPFSDATFGVALLQHVAMNIAERAALYREIRRVLVPGGRFATYDVVRGDGEPDYPLPWARAAATSFLLTEADTQKAIEAAGFRPRVWIDETALAAASFAALDRGGPARGLSLGVVMGPDFRSLAESLGRAIATGRLRVVSGVFEAT
jgi:SAM-dependent methyltransferase